jgi:hypothetical protein
MIELQYFNGKEWTINCENRFHIYRNWIVQADNEQVAWIAFLNKKGGTTQGFKNIIIKSVNQI